MPFFPLHVDLAGRTCVVVGGGEIAERRVELLVECGADVTLISPEIRSGLQEHADAGRVRFEAREYRKGDLDGAFLVTGTTGDLATDARIAADARAAVVLANLASSLELCDFIVPSLVRRGDLLIGVSTGGGSPVLSSRIRERLEAQYGPEYGRFIEFLRDYRKALVERHQDESSRRKAIECLIDSDALRLIKEGREGELEERALTCIS